MNNWQLDDLKQFIETTVGRTEARLTERLVGVEGRLDGVEGRLTSLEQKVDDGFAAIGDAIDQIRSRIDEHENNTALHAGKLQRQTA